MSTLSPWRFAERTRPSAVKIKAAGESAGDGTKCVAVPSTITALPFDAALKTCVPMVTSPPGAAAADKPFWATTSELPVACTVAEPPSARAIVNDSDADVAEAEALVGVPSYVGLETVGPTGSAASAEDWASERTDKAFMPVRNPS
jgi:hypothetical protein